MPTRIIHWEITDAFAKFGFADGDGHNFTDDVAAAIEAAGPYRCPRQIWGLHNYVIEAIEEERAPDEWVRIAEFDGCTLPALAEPAGSHSRCTRRPQRRRADRVGALTPPRRRRRSPSLVEPWSPGETAQRASSRRRTSNEQHETRDRTTGAPGRALE